MQELLIMLHTLFTLVIFFCCRVSCVACACYERRVSKVKENVRQRCTNNTHKYKASAVI
jgi:hypothetical protein